MRPSALVPFPGKPADGPLNYEVNSKFISSFLAQLQMHFNQGNKRFTSFQKLRIGFRGNTID